MSLDTSKRSTRENGSRRRDLLEHELDGQIIREYLESIGLIRQPVSEWTQTGIYKRLADISFELDTATMTKRVDLIKERNLLRSKLSAFPSPHELQKMEDSFIRVLCHFSSKTGISYEIWSASGVCQTVLAKAGMTCE
jgi:hypothetical protein